MEQGSEKFVILIKKLNKYRIFDTINLVGCLVLPILLLLNQWFIAAVIFIGFTPCIEEIKSYLNRLKLLIAKNMFNRMMKQFN